MLARIRSRLRRWLIEAPSDDAGDECRPGAGLQPVPDASLQDSMLGGWFQNRTGELLRGFQVSESDTVVDVGCGDGKFAYFCGNQGAEVIMADVDATSLDRARERLMSTRARAVSTHVVKDGDRLPVPDETASRVVAMEVLEHVSDPAAFMAELVRVGKPGAQYLISVPGTLSESIQKTLAPPGYFEFPNHVRIFTPEAFEQLIVSSGLIVERKESYGFYHAVWWSFFWTCDQELKAPWHPLLESWEKTWGLLLATRDGEKVKHALDAHMPKSQAILARKPLRPGVPG